MIASKFLGCWQSTRTSVDALGSFIFGYQSTYFPAILVTYWPSSFLRSSSFLWHVYTTLSIMEKWSTSHVTLKSVGTQGGSPAWASIMRFLLFLSHAAFPALLRNGGTRLYSLRFISFFQVLGLRPSCTEQKGFQGTGQPLTLSPPPGHTPPPV